MKRSILSILLMIVTYTSWGNFVKTSNGIKTNVSGTSIELEFYTPNTVRVTKTPTGGKRTAESYAVILQPEKVPFEIKQNEDVVQVRTTQLDVTLSLASGKITFVNRGTTLLQEGDFRMTAIGEGVDKGHFKARQSFELEADEPVYGIGMLQNGKLSQRDENRLMIQSNQEDYTNFFQSIKGYGILWDNYSPIQLSDNPWTFESQVADCIDYYFMFGGNADGVIKAMRHLTGEVPMLPLWTYGFHQSRERYTTQYELLDVIKKYREFQIPLDGIIQDWQYWDSNYTWNAMDFLSPGFADPKQMVESVHQDNAHILISIWASFGKETKAYKELAEKNLLLHFNTWPMAGPLMWPPRTDYPSGVLCYDAYSKEARDIYWKYLQNLQHIGIDGWWMDSTDPDHINIKETDYDEVTTITSPSGKESKGSWRSVRNLYPLQTVGNVYEKQRATDSTKRVFILTRSMFAGQQRYGANTWSGDINSSWDVLRKQVPLCLNMTLCANPNVNSDIGGFFAGEYNGKYGSGTAQENPQFGELYVRWMQFGTFCPMMRSHGTSTPREIYLFGKKGDPVYDALVKQVRQRYLLLPYIYSTSWQVTKSQDSFMRALPMDFANDKNTWDNTREFMFGRSLLVAPVLEALYTEEQPISSNELSGWDQPDKDRKLLEDHTDWTLQKSYDVYLPSGANWFEFSTGKHYNGGQTVSASACLDEIPLYVKEGSILPLGPDVQYSNEKAWDNLEIIIYPGKNANFTLYEDEGDNYNYERGKYTEIPFIWNEKAHTLTIDRRIGSYNGMLGHRTFRVRLYNGNIVPVNYDGRKKTIKL
ncbi:MAG: glycoside hydrolase family 31 protein [Prevotella sp.]|nr:glycoside hydrolase family 31 protein [Prevotella sp.]